MRKIALLTALVILLVIPTSVQAAEPRLITPSLNLSYNQSIATCTVNIIGESTSDYLRATIKLWRGNSCIETWEETGYGYIFFSETATVIRGYVYTLTVDLTVNGVAQDTVSFSKKYATVRTQNATISWISPFNYTNERHS